jgi:cytochrome c553
MKKRNLKALRLHKKSIAKFMFQIQGARQDASFKRTQSAIPLCPGCHTIQGMDPECDIQ